MKPCSPPVSPSFLGRIGGHFGRSAERPYIYSYMRQIIMPSTLMYIIPEKAGIHGTWIPAYVGMTFEHSLDWWVTFHFTYPTLLSQNLLGARIIPLSPPLGKGVRFL